MSFIRKEDAAKAGKLVGAIVTVFGCAAWRVVGAVSPPPAPPTKTDAPAPVATEAVAPAPAKPSDAEIQAPVFVTPAGADPFRPLVADRNPPPATPTPAPAPAPSPIGGSFAPLPPATGELAKPALIASPLPAATPVPEGAAYRLSGILPGDDATAVLDQGEESLVVRKGSRLPDGSTVVKIDATSVVLERGGKTSVLTFGE